MISAVTKEHGHTKWDWQMEEDRAVPVNIIEDMMETEAAKEVYRYLTHTADRPPTEKMFLSIRDYLSALRSRELPTTWPNRVCNLDRDEPCKDT